MPRRVELVHRADQPNTEPGLDLSRLAHLQEPVKALEGLHILPTRRSLAARDREVANNPVDVQIPDSGGLTMEDQSVNGRLLGWIRILALFAVFVALGLYLFYVGVDPASAGCDVGH
jgi:hypothetical protein